MGTVALDAMVFIALGLEESATRTPRVLSVVSSVLERSIRKNEKLIRRSKMKDVITIFHASEVPALSIRRYIERIFKYSSCSPSCFVVAYIYIERFLQRRGICLTSLNIHRLLITSIMAAAKFMDDECYSNAYYAKIGGVSISELNKLEIEFLLSLDFKLHVTIEMFGKYCQQLEDEGVGENQISRRLLKCPESVETDNATSDCSNTQFGDRIFQTPNLILIQIEEM